MKNSAKLTRRQASKLIGWGSTSLLTYPFGYSQKNIKMNTRTIASTNEKIPMVGLGTWQSFDVGQSATERAPLKKVLNILVQHGGSVIDSSPMYGRSEEVVGDLTSELQLKDNLFEATKVWTTGKDAGINQMNTSFDLLKVKRMDLMQIHNLIDWRTHLKTLKKWKAEGKIRYIGITHYLESAYKNIKQIIKTEKLDFLQINYNLAVRDAAKTLIPLAQDKGMGVIINRPYEGGSLFGKTNGKQLPPWAAEFDARSWGQFFLKFILAHPGVTCVIPGTSKPHHMEDNVQAGFGRLPTAAHQKKMISLIES